MGKLSDLFFGSIALKNRVLSPAQLAAALREQGARTRDGRGPTLGEVCRALGMLEEEEVNAILWAQAKSEVLLEDSLCGQIAVANRLVTRADLDSALEEQKARGQGARLGAILIERGKLTEQQLQAILKTQTRLRPVISPPARPTIVPPAKGWAPTPPPAPTKKTKKKQPKKASR